MFWNRQKQQISTGKYHTLENQDLKLSSPHTSLQTAGDAADRSVWLTPRRGATSHLPVSRRLRGGAPGLSTAASPLQLLLSDGQLEPAAGLPQLGQTLSCLSCLWQGTQSSWPPETGQDSKPLQTLAGQPRSVSPDKSLPQWSVRGFISWKVIQTQVGDYSNISWSPSHHLFPSELNSQASSQNNIYEDIEDSLASLGSETNSLYMCISEGRRNHLKSHKFVDWDYGLTPDLNQQGRRRQIRKSLSRTCSSILETLKSIFWIGIKKWFGLYFVSIYFICMTNAPAAEALLDHSTIKLQS